MSEPIIHSAREAITLMRVKPLLAAIGEKYYWNMASPFRNQSFLNIYYWLCGKLISGMEKKLGCSIYVSAWSSLRDALPPSFRSVIWRLMENNLISDVSRPDPIPGWPQIPAFHLSLADGTVNSGYALDEELAARKALAELLERHSMSVYDHTKFIRGCFTDLKNRGARNPRSFSVFSESQLSLPEYALYKIGESDILTWANATSLITKEKVLVPAQLLHFSLAGDLGEPRIKQTTTNGAAAGTSWEMAAYNAVCECIERDAFIIHWLNRISPPKIELDSIRRTGDARLNTLLDLYNKYNIAVTVFDISTDLAVPVVLTAVREQISNRPIVYVSPRADLDVEEALVCSLTDGLRWGFWPDIAKAEIDRVTAKTSPVSNIGERRTYWSDSTRERDIAFLWGGSAKNLPFNYCRGFDFSKKLSLLRDILKEAKIEVWLSDITAPQAQKLGVTVLMSLSTDLVPFYLDEKFKCLGVRRIYTVPVSMGVSSSSNNEDELNPASHPML